jgi:hypothetical protein
MRQLNGVYIQASNRRHGRSGHLLGCAAGWDNDMNPNITQSTVFLNPMFRI